MPLERSQLDEIPTTTIPALVSDCDRHRSAYFCEAWPNPVLLEPVVPTDAGVVVIDPGGPGATAEATVQALVWPRPVPLDNVWLAVLRESWELVGLDTGCRPRSMTT